jgi:hypothetical protein
MAIILDVVALMVVVFGSGDVRGGHHGARCENDGEAGQPGNGRKILHLLAPMLVLQLRCSL